MDNSKQVFLGLFLLLVTGALMAQVSTPPNGGNQKSVVRQYMGAIPYVEIVYNSPDVTGPNGQSRKGNIWGGVVPYGFQALGFGLSTADNPSPWRAGANENTTVEFSHDVLVEGKELPAGKYGFFIAPAEEGPWTLIFSKDNNHWGSFFYQPENDALRLEVEAEEADFHEWLTYEFLDRQVSSCTVAMMWENKKVPFTVEVKNNDKIHLAAIDAELKNSPGFSFPSYQAAANYASSVEAYDQAITWADAAISAPFVGQRNFGTMSTKATVLRAAGKDAEAMEIMDEAITMPGANAGTIHQYGRQLISANEDEKALEVFKYNAEANKGQWPTNYGLARGYSAVGDYKQALKYLKLAKENIPSNDTLNGPIIDQNIEKLKKGEDIN